MASSIQPSISLSSLNHSNHAVESECRNKITKIFSFQLSKNQKQLLLNIAHIVIRILYVFALVLMAATIFPLESLFIPGFAVGGAVLTGFFFRSRNETPPPVYKRLPPLLPPLRNMENERILDRNRQKLEDLQIAQTSKTPPSEIIAARPVGLFCSEMNSSFNALIHYLDSDPETANRLRCPPPLSRSQLRAFEDFLALLHPPAHLIESFRHFLAVQKLPHRLTAAFKLFIDGYKPLPKDHPSFIKFAQSYNRLLIAVRPFRKFFAAYDRAIQENRSIADADSQAIRLALSRANPSIAPSDRIPQDPAELLKYILHSLPETHQIEYEAAVHYDTRGLPPIDGVPDGIAGRKERTWGFTLEINEKAPRLEKMFQAICHRQSENPRVKFPTANGKTCYYRPKFEEVLFTKAPSVLRFQIKRFGQPADAILNRVLRRPSKIDTPIQAPSELEVRLKNGTVQKYRLTSLVNCEGNSLSNGHFVAGRIMNGQRYLIDDHKVIPIDQRTWEEQIVPQAYLLFYLPVEP